jgi:hypothetical protein
LSTKDLLPENVREATRGKTIAMLSIQGEDIITTAGAEIPVSHFVRAMSRNLDKLETDTKFETPIRIGEFEVQEIRSGFILAGCHAVPVFEAKRILELLKKSN